MTIYAYIKDGAVVAQSEVADTADGVGPPPPSTVDDYYDLVSIVQSLPIRPSGNQQGVELLWNDGNPTWNDTRTLAELRAAKVTELQSACGIHIIGGFTSSAIGTAHMYPSALMDQHNLNGLVTRSLYAPAGWTDKFWCADPSGIWARREHTAAQLQQVGDEAIARITAAQAKCDTLIAQAMTATADQLSPITW